MYRELSKSIYKRVLDEYDQEVVTDELHDWLKPNNSTSETHKSVSTQHCNSKFHQTCLGRRQEASFDCHFLVEKDQYDFATGAYVKVLYLKDIKHLLCNTCLQEVQGHLETQYTGALPGERVWA